MKFACLWKLENNFVFDQGFSSYNAIMQLKGDKHEIENTQQEFPRPCVIYSSEKYVDFKNVLITLTTNSILAIL